jgi:O-antigen ligase
VRSALAWGSVSALVGIAAAAGGANIAVVLAVLLLLALALIAIPYTPLRGRFSEMARGNSALASITIGALSIAVVTSSWNGLRAGAGLALCDVFFVIAAGAFVCLALTSRTGVAVWPSWLVWSALILLIDVLFTAILWEGSAVTLVSGFRLVLATALTPLLIGFAAGNLRCVNQMVSCWILSAVVNAGIALTDYLSGSHIGPSITGIPALERQAGLTTQPNHLGFVCVFALPFVINRVAKAERWTARTAYFGCALICLGGLLASGSRGGLVAGVFVLASAPLFQATIRRRAVTVLAVIVVVAAVGVTLLPSSFQFVSIERILGSSNAVSSVELSNSERAVQIEEAIEQFDSSPIVGTGFGEVLAAQNIYLQLLAAGGFIALFAWLMFALGGLFSALQMSRAGPPSLRSLSGAVAGVFAGWLLLGMVENQLYDRYLFVPCGIFVGCLVYAAQERRLPEASARAYIPSSSPA